MCDADGVFVDTADGVSVPLRDGVRVIVVVAVNVRLPVDDAVNDCDKDGPLVCDADGVVELEVVLVSVPCGDDEIEGDGNGASGGAATPRNVHPGGAVVINTGAYPADNRIPTSNA